MAEHMLGVNRLLGAAVLLVAGFSSQAVAQPRVLGNQSLSITVGTGPGGGYDTYARLAARHIPRFLQNGHTVVVRNVPGAGGATALNWLYNAAPRDGTALAVFSFPAALEPLWGNSLAKYDPRRFTWLISFTSLINIGVVWHETPFTTAQDFFDKEVIVGGSTAGTDPSFMPLMLNSLLGTRFKVISGYAGGTNAIALAMEQREVDGIVGTSWDSVKATKPTWITDNKVRVLLQVSLAKHPELENVPTVMQFVKDEETKRVLEVLLAGQAVGRPLVGTPEMPQGSVSLLSDAVEKMASDAEFLDEAARMKLEIRPTFGAAIRETIDRIYEAPSAVIERATSERMKASK